MKKEEKPWSAMTEEQWKKERERIRKLQDMHFHDNKSEKLK